MNPHQFNTIRHNISCRPTPQPWDIYIIKEEDEEEPKSSISKGLDFPRFHNFY